MKTKICPYPYMLPILVPVVLALLVTGCGQASITGRVIDDRNNPVHEARIQTKPATDFIITNQQGLFLLERQLQQAEYRPLPLGHYHLVVSKVGYDPTVVPVVVSRRRRFNVGLVQLNRRRAEAGELEDDLEGVGFERVPLEPPIEGN